MRAFLLLNVILESQPGVCVCVCVCLADWMAALWSKSLCTPLLLSEFPLNLGTDFKYIWAPISLNVLEHVSF